MEEKTEKRKVFERTLDALITLSHQCNCTYVHTQPALNWNPKVCWVRFNFEKPSDGDKFIRQIENVGLDTLIRKPCMGSIEVLVRYSEI